MSSRASRTIYVGNLPGDVREREIEDLFYKVKLHLLFIEGNVLQELSLVWRLNPCFIFLLQYGRIVDIDLKLPPRPPGYCFIEVITVNVLVPICEFYVDLIELHSSSMS